MHLGKATAQQSLHLKRVENGSEHWVFLGPWHTLWSSQMSYVTQLCFKMSWNIFVICDLRFWLGKFNVLKMMLFRSSSDSGCWLLTNLPYSCVVQKLVVFRTFQTNKMLILQDLLFGVGADARISIRWAVTKVNWNSGIHHKILTFGTPKPRNHDIFKVQKYGL